MPEAPAFSVLVADIDGTLVGEDLVVRPAVAAAIRAAQTQGARVHLATGRMWKTAKVFVAAAGADPPVILYNGGVLYDFASGRTLWSRRLSIRGAARILPVLRRFPEVSPLIFIHGTAFTERMTPLVERYARRDRLSVEVAPDFVPLLTEPPMKFLVVGEPPGLARLSRALGRLPGPPVNRVYSQPNYLEILPGGVSKGTALRVLARMAHLPRRGIVAVGDNLNDLSMLQAAGLGIAVEGSPRALLAAAGWVCPPPEQEGVRAVIERWFLPRRRANLAIGPEGSHATEPGAEAVFKGPRSGGNSVFSLGHPP